MVCSRQFTVYLAGPKLYIYTYLYIIYIYIIYNINLLHKLACNMGRFFMSICKYFQ